MESGDALTAAATRCAQAEHAQWLAIITEREARTAAIEVDESTSGMYRRMATNAVALEMAHTLHISEQQVWRIIEQGTRLRDRAPAAWAAFGDGVISAQKASVIAVAVDRCADSETIAVIDHAAVDFAVRHTPAELRRWLNKLIDRLEPIDVDEANTEREKRFVEVQHTHHGMSYLTAYLPSVAAVAIKQRLRKTARTLDTERTLAQRETDLFVAWLTTHDGTDANVSAEIAVLVEAETLAGVTDTPGYVVDSDDAPIPVAWVHELAQSGNAVWTRLLTDPSGHVLDVTHHGYQPPAALREAMVWRDRTCRVSGCHRRADESDLDHIKPFDTGGPTTGSNLRSLCRRHHGMKGHGVLPADCYQPPEIHLVRLPTPALTMEYAA